MSNKLVSQFNETDDLKLAIIGRYQGYRMNSIYEEIINETQIIKGLPSEQALENEFKIFEKTLRENGIQVEVPEWIGPFCYDQLTPRDIGFVIGNDFLICNMKKWSRRYEFAGIINYLKKFDWISSKFIVPDASTCYIEGGDIILDKSHIYVGISERSNYSGLGFLYNYFRSKFKVVPIQLNHPILHLDCVFMPIGEDSAIIYKEGIKFIPAEIQLNYKNLIEINEVEQNELASNILSLSKTKLISRDHPNCKRVNDKIRELGIEVIEIQFNETIRTGGSFRCCTLPLIRGMF